MSLDYRRAFLLSYFIRTILFWLLLFNLFRLSFIFSQAERIQEISLMLIIETLQAGIKLDLSTTSYLILPSFLLWTCYQVSAKKIFLQINQIFHFILFFAFSYLYVGTIKMYHEWQTLLNVSVFDYLAHPSEVTSFISTGELIVLLLTVVLIWAVMCIGWKKIVRGFDLIQKKLWQKLLVILVFPVLAGIAARGGFQLIPINESAAYFSDQAVLNHAAINPIWYFIHSILEKEDDGNPYISMDPAAAKARMEHLFSNTSDSFPSLLTTETPNVVFIILESWTADIIERLGGEKGITPNFDSLSHQGILFSDIYAAGGRTEHGLVSVLSGYPPPPGVSIITIPYKADKLDNINAHARKHGYSSSFFYGGEIGFVNMKGYLRNAGFTNIIDKNDFDHDQMNSKWGAHDEYVFARQLKELQGETQPFLSVVLTLSTHEPFEVPMKTPFARDSEPEQFRNAAWYTDYALGQYFKEAAKQPWHDNTLFVLVADHGHRLPRNTDVNRPASKRIPLLLLGEVLNSQYRDTIMTMIGSQHDIPGLLMSQLGWDRTDFPVSRNLLQPQLKEFAYYITDYAMGWIASDTAFIYVLETGETYSATTTGEKIIVPDSILLDAKAFLQNHYQNFLSY